MRWPESSVSPPHSLRVLLFVGVSLALVFFHLFETRAGLQKSDSKTKTSRDTQGQQLLSGSAPIVTVRIVSRDGGSGPCHLGQDRGLELAGPQNLPSTDGCTSVAAAFLPVLSESGSFAANQRVVFFFLSFFRACGNRA